MSELDSRMVVLVELLHVPTTNCAHPVHTVGILRERVQADLSIPFPISLLPELLRLCYQKTPTGDTKRMGGIGAPLVNSYLP